MDFDRISVVAQYIRGISMDFGNGGFWPKMEHFQQKGEFLSILEGS